MRAPNRFAAPGAAILSSLTLALAPLGLCAWVSPAARAEELTPPQPLETPPAIAPEGLQQAAEVLLLVTIGIDGRAHGVDVAQSAGPALDGAAIAAVVRWTFRPALRDGQPFEARVRIPFRFAPAGEPADAGPPGDAGQSIPATTAAAPPLSQDGGAGESIGPPINSSGATLEEAAAQDAGPRQESIGAPTIAGQDPASASSTVDATSGTADAGPVLEVSVRGTQRKVEHGASDFVIDVGQLAIVPHKKAEDLLQLAPGIFLANEGGEGHAEQVFLRGFDAAEGQSIEFTVNGVPINEVDNPDSHGYADTHFIIPELVKDLQVTEGPFDPRQGDFAVAGSAAYELGVRERGLRFSAAEGSFATQRLLALWAPPGEREGTFAAAQFSKSDGFGTNRASESASAMAGYEGELGQRGLYRLLLTTYTTHYSSAGVVRLDDVEAGRIGFYGSEDPSQGGDAVRHTLSFQLESPVGDSVASFQTFLTWRTLRIVEDFTGFLLDNQEYGQSPHDQRGDAVEKTYSALTAGGRASDRLRFKLFDREQSIEAGLYTRYDHTDPMIQRLRFGTQIPYLIDQDLETDIANIAAYVDADIRPLSFLTLRGGVREEFYSYDVLDLCATAGNYAPTEPLNELCPAYDKVAGGRSPTQRTTASGETLSPKATALVALPANLTLAASYGVGARSLDPTSIEQNENAPFVTLHAAEVGLTTKGRSAGFDWSARAVAFETKESADQVFDPDLGRLAPSSATTRQGALVAGRATSRWLDESISFTAVHPTFDDDGTLVPYTPLAIGRSDTALFGWLPLEAIYGHRLRGELGVGLGYVGKRSLPFSQFSSPTLQLDSSASVRWGAFKFGVSVTNLTNQEFPLSEFFYASDFHSRLYPTLAPTEHITAAPPRTFLFTLELDLQREEEQ